MKKISVILLLTLILSFSAMSQTTSKPKTFTLPTNIAKNVGKYPDVLFRDASIKSRMKKLMGKNYASFFESFETQAPFVKKGDFLFSSGCLIHACGHLESAIAIDLVNKTIHTAIYNEIEPTKYFNEGNRKIPTAIQEWANNLVANR